MRNDSKVPGEGAGLNFRMPYDLQFVRQPPISVST